MKKYLINTLLLAVIFYISFVLDIIPLGANIEAMRPHFVLLSLFYWLLAKPYLISIMTAFSIGVLWDSLHASVLGTHSLVLSIYAYVINRYHFKLRNMSLIPAMMLVFVAIVIFQLGIFAIESLEYQRRFDVHSVIGVAISAVLWVIWSALMRFLRHRFWKKK